MPKLHGVEEPCACKLSDHDLPWMLMVRLLGLNHLFRSDDQAMALIGRDRLVALFDNHVVHHRATDAGHVLAVHEDASSAGVGLPCPILRSGIALDQQTHCDIFVVHDLTCVCLLVR